MQDLIWETHVLHTFPPLATAETVATSVEHLIYIFLHKVSHLSLICWHNHSSLALNRSQCDRCTSEEQSCSCSQTVGVRGKV